MQLPRNLAGVLLGLGMWTVCLGQQPGDVMQTRHNADLVVDGETAAVLQQGSIVTVEKSKKADDDLLWCRTPNGTGWIARGDLMTCQDAVPVWQKMIEDGNVAGYFLLGLAHDQLGDFKAAAEDFNACMWYFPSSVESVERRGFARLKLGLTKRAEQDSAAAIRMQPNPESYVNRANARLVLGNGEGALADCNTALETDPDNLYGLINRGSAERMLGQFDKAVADYERAAAIDDKSYAVNRNFAFLRAACPDPAFRDGAKALELAKKACEATNYRDAWSLSSLAAASAETGDWDAAVKWENEAIAVDKLKRNEPEHKRRLEAFQAKQPYRFKVGEPVLDD
ncbi:MAG TPA: tetratricopeptide repeat protein [Pirellulales bacterium]|nr:tetratricopeptide repeat protein [Pirellulales bacterium]